MVPIINVIFYVIFFISMICAIFTSAKLYLSGKNYLIAVLSGAMACGEFVVLLSIIWIDDFEKNVPREFCFFQGIAVSCLHFEIHIIVNRRLCSVTINP